MSDEAPPGTWALPPKAAKAVDAPPPGTTEVKPPWKGDQYDVGPGAIMDTLGLTDRPGADNPVRVLTKPETLGESMIAPAIAAPALYYAGPAAARYGLPAVAGRILASGAMGGAQAAARGDDLSNVGTHALLDMAVSGVTEGAGGVVTKAAGKVAKPLTEALEKNEGMRRAFKRATEAPPRVLEELKHRLRGAKVVVPSLGPDKIALDEAVKKLVTLEGDAFKTTYKEIADWLKRLDKQAIPKPNAGQVFKDRTSSERFTPPSAPTGTAAQQAAKWVAEIAQKPGMRATLDALANALFPGSRAPIGALAMAAAAGSPLVKHIPGAKKITEVVEEAE